MVEFTNNLPEFIHDILRRTAIVGIEILPQGLSVILANGLVYTIDCFTDHPLQ